MEKNQEKATIREMEPQDEHCYNSIEKIVPAVKIKSGITERCPNPTTALESFAHVLKCNIGIGILAMPDAFLKAGLWVGFGLTPIVGAICVHAMHLLLVSSQELCKREGVVSLSYEETAVLSVKLGPKPIRPYFNIFGRIISSFLCITQIGLCCIYYLFVTQSFYLSLACWVDIEITQLHYMLILIMPLMAICLIKDLKYLVPFSIFAGTIQSVSTVILFYYLFRDLGTFESEAEAFGSWSGLPLYFGSVMFTFEGIGSVLPIENKMKNPSHFRGWTGVLNIGMMVAICLYTALGFFGYFRYDDDVLGSIMLNLPNEILAQCAILLMAMAIFFTYPLQFYVAVSVISPQIRKRFESSRMQNVADNVIRILLVLLTFCFAAALPNIGLFINLVGAISCSMLAVILPPIIDTLTLWPYTGKYHWRIIKNGCISGVGLLGSVAGTFVSIKAIVDFTISDRLSLTAVDCSSH